MTEKPTAPEDDEPIVVDQTDKRTVLPFVAAAVFAAIVLVAVVIGGVLSPAEKNVTEADRIAGAAQNYASARNASDRRPPPGVACDGFDEGRSPLAAQFAGDTATIPKVADQTVNGDRAKAAVTVRVGDRETTETWDFTRAGDKWLVCD
ncbi:Rv0361 family membrane protein [Nocardia bovistercoris]|uniref:DUF4878 domain-containing protein n=1 Tax=Nocardia bovistercoris TaxID=2785916 RepID=A0A931IBR7_9NOCA|nr:hypothetical protein [Nocardia bovistercoris]MBH0778136.1 hypothetical protein [Nocardia bovistercoris]